VSQPIAGWKLDRGQREDLLRRFPPRYAEVVADHVTYGRVPRADLPSHDRAELVGRADDGAGVEAMVVALGGSTDRPTGGTYHVTWSLGRGREAVESNDVIGARGWEPLSEAVSVELAAAEWS
jgi:hypothetical protein